MAWGKEETDTKLDEAIKAIAVNECCTLVYTVSKTQNYLFKMFEHRPFRFVHAFCFRFGHRPPSNVSF